jgi:hypothetical protein
MTKDDENAIKEENKIEENYINMYFDDGQSIFSTFHDGSIW